MSNGGIQKQKTALTARVPLLS